MSFKVSFLEWKHPLSKTITATETKTFPNARNVSSHSHLCSSIEDMFKHITTHAAKGHCLLKGPLDEELSKESRAGKISPNTPTSWIVIDIDKLEMPCPKTLTKKTFQKLADEIIQLLPSFLHNTSYIAQASSSLGFKQQTVSLHLFFALDTPLAPSSLKNWLTNLNFTLDFFKDRLELTKTGWDVKYTLDRCMADNSRIVYIAPPVIQGIPNPFKNNKDRIILVKKENTTLPSTRIQDDASLNTTSIKNDTIKELRKKAGLDIRQKAKFTKLTIDGRQANILTNPSAVVLEPSYVDRGWCYYNINGGDSNAYYHPEGKPEYIYNFKDEPIFRWKDVDPTGYQHYVDNNVEVIRKKNPLLYFAVISKQDDNLYKIVHNLNTDELRVSKSDFAKTAHFYRENGQVMPETIEEWDIVFDPNNLSKVDYEEKIINTYQPSEFIIKTKPPKKDCTYENFQTSCPNISKLLYHVFGNGEEELKHWLNWLAFVAQEKRKSNTCWFLWGVQGTGKGVLFNHILKPMFGKTNTSLHLNTSLEDTFDAWRADKQLVVIDEFELPQGKKGDRILERIKNWTAEGDNSIRDMQKVLTTKEGIEAYMFFSNRFDMIKIEDHDRRFNIAPRQEQPLKQTDWWKGKDTIDAIDHELQNFTDFIFHFPFDEVEARTALLNEAKIQAADATKTTAENFCTAIKKNDLSFFIDLLYLSPEDLGYTITDDEHFILKAAQAEIRRWVAENAKDPHALILVAPHQMTNVYQAIASQRLSSPATSKMLARHGIRSTHTSYNGKKGRFFQLVFNHHGLTKAEYKILITDTLAKVTNLGKAS